MDQSVGIASAFIAGVLSFLSPCVLPLIPAYLSFMTGLTMAELSSATGGEADEDAPKIPLASVLAPALLFVAGFSVVFVALGATASVLGQFLLDYRLVIEKLAGIAVFAFGFLMLGIIKVPWLYGEARFGAMYGEFWNGFTSSTVIFPREVNSYSRSSSRQSASASPSPATNTVARVFVSNGSMK